MAVRIWFRCAIAAIAVVLVRAGTARAGEASVTVRAPDDGRWAEPPPGRSAPAAPSADAEAEAEDYRSPVRFGVGPSGFLTRYGQGMGLGASADFGTGVVGVRLAGSWMAPGSALALDQYTAELVLDPLPHGSLHPVLGVGFGFAHMDVAGVGGDLGVGVGRLGVEYSFGLKDADLRVSADVTGGLPGPRDPTVPSDLGAYVVFGGGVSLGF